FGSFIIALLTYINKK
ncbi:putative holin-like toxin, partial [Bacillus atrophaeus]